MALTKPLLALALIATAMVASALTFPASAPIRPVLAGIASQNDAGSGQDAGNTPLQALLVPSVQRTFTGNLTPAGTDTDWYRHETTAATCTQAQATTSIATQLTIANDAQRNHTTSRGAPARQAVALALATPAGQTPFFGVEPGLTSPALVTTVDTSGGYTFSFQSFGLSDLDPRGLGEVPEAGATRATAVVVPGPCFAGRLASSVGDTVDQFYFDVSAPQDITLSFAIATTGASHVRLIDPAGTLRATLATGDATTTYASGAGRWYLVVERPTTVTLEAGAPISLLHTAIPSSSATSDTDYLIGLTLDGGTNPCRPACS